MAADTNYQGTGLQRRQDGSTALPTGGSLDIESGAALKIAGTDKTATLSAAVAGIAAGYKIARGTVTCDGSNPTPIVTGLASVVSCCVTLLAASTPGDDPSWCSVNFGGGVTAGTVNLYAYKNTGGTDPTLVDSTSNSAVFSWIAIGT